MLPQRPDNLSELPRSMTFCRIHITHDSRNFCRALTTRPAISKVRRNTRGTSERIKQWASLRNFRGASRQSHWSETETLLMNISLQFLKFTDYPCFQSVMRKTKIKYEKLLIIFLQILPTIVIKQFRYCRFFAEACATSSWYCSHNWKSKGFATKEELLHIIIEVETRCRYVALLEDTSSQQKWAEFPFGSFGSSEVTEMWRNSSLFPLVFRGICCSLARINHICHFCPFCYPTSSIAFSFRVSTSGFMQHFRSSLVHRIGLQRSKSCARMRIGWVCQQWVYALLLVFESYAKPIVHSLHCYISAGRRLFFLFYSLFWCISKRLHGIRLI